MTFSLNELQVLRSSLDVIEIKGSDAQYVATLQVKLESEIIKIQKEMTEGPKELQNPTPKKRSSKK